MPTRCFWLEPSREASRYLRRFTWARDDAAPCSSTRGYHEAIRDVGSTRRLMRRPDGTPLPGWGLRPPPHRDPRWPVVCEECGYRFAARDEWQHRVELLYVRSDTGALVTRADAPPGAMWDAADYMPEDWRGPDGRSIIVRCPNGMDWPIDAPASGSGGRWTRSGQPPELSVRPSIAIGLRTDPRFGHYWLGVEGQPPGVFSDHLG
jgi:hypothetical protein